MVHFLRHRRHLGGPGGAGIFRGLVHAGADQLADFAFVEHFAFEQGLGERVEFVGVLVERALCAVLGRVQNLGDFLVDHLGGVLAELPFVLGDFAAQERMVLADVVGDRARAARSCPSG